MAKNPGAMDGATISGMDRLKFEDQKRIKALITGGDAALETRAVNDEEKALAKESDLVWKKVTQLEALSNGELAELLEANGEPHSGKIFGGRNNMLQRAADAMVFGVLPVCTQCGGHLRPSNCSYHCTGSIDEFTRCEFTTTEVDRKPFTVPSELREAHSFLKSFKFTGREKVAAKLDLVPANKRNAAEAAEDATAQPCFAGRVVTCAGKLSRTQKDIEQLIVANGGTFVKSLAANICITNFEEATGGGSQRGRDAVTKGLLCVSEGWVDECIKQARPLTAAESTPFVLANPKIDTTTRAHRSEAAAAAEAKAAVSRQDALAQEAFKSQAAAKSALRKVVVKGASAVHEDSGLVDEGHILVKNGDQYQATLNLADVTTGQNSYYILQVIEHDTKMQYTTFRKWGKVGNDDVSGNKITHYPTADAAIREFKKVFVEKTGNEWEQRANFKKVFGKFVLLDIDYSSGGAATGGPSSGSTDYAGPLDNATKRFVELIFDLKVMTDELKELEIDTEKMPLGKISKKNIGDAFSALKSLQEALTEADEAKRRTLLVSGSNRFYSFVPHAAKPGEKLPLIDTEDAIRAKSELLSTLSEMEIATKLMSSGTVAGEHPVDANFKKLRSNLREIPKGTDEWTRIHDYLQNTHGSTHTMYSLELVDLLELRHEGDEERFKKHSTNPNRKLLWHGSRLSNWVGIISQGLRIAPPEAPSTGYMFGKGAYFADMSSKSANYCFTTSEKTTGILMLCEVALGNMQTRKAAFFETAIPNATHQSTFGAGKNHPDPKQAFTEPSGCVIPLGKGVASPYTDTTLLYNEFIVYDTAQVMPRYLLRLNFNYKKKCGTFF